MHSGSEEFRPGGPALHKLRDAIPSIREWIASYVAQHAGHARTVASLSFERLADYYAGATLASTKVVPVERVQAPPLSAMGLPGFAAFEQMPAAGITYDDTFFVARDLDRDESLFFHELVHVIQWRTLGPEAFLMLYGLGLAQSGYEDSPLEAMAYGLQAKFEAGEPIPGLEDRVARETLALATQMAKLSTEDPEE